MSEFMPVHDPVLQYQVDSRARTAGAARTRLATRPARPRGRHGLAQRLHALADRIDG